MNEATKPTPQVIGEGNFSIKKGQRMIVEVQRPRVKPCAPGGKKR